MRVGSVGFATDLAVLRAGGSIIVEADDHLVVSTSANPGFWWGNSVLLAAPELVARGVKVFHHVFPDAAHLAIGVDGTDGAVPPAAARSGLDADVSVVLTAAAVGPAGGVDAEVRVLSDNGDWEQLVELRRTDNNLADDETYQRRRVEEARRLADGGSGIFLGAFRDGRLVPTLGVLFDGSGTVRYQHVLTQPEHRHQGLAGHLVAMAAESPTSAGKSTGS